MSSLVSRLLAVVLVAWSVSAPAADHRFEKEIAAFEAQDQKSPPPMGAILFVGDSTFTKWKTLQADLPEFTVLNRGFGGSGMGDLVFFADRVVLAYQPRLIVVNEGGNDIHGGRTPEQLLADTKAFVQKVRSALPEVPIILDSITPNPGRWAEVDTRKKANALTKEYAATQKNVTFVNLFDPFLGSDGQPRPELYIEDKVHPSPAGYALRVEILRPLLGAPERAVGAKK